MEQRRAAGILLHPTSLPGPHGIGSLGRDARRFVDFLAEAKLSLWQVLPLGPTGFGDSPYNSPSSFAGNPLLVDLEELVASGDLDPSDLDGAPALPPAAVDYVRVAAWKLPLLGTAARRFLAHASPERREGFAAFCRAQAGWLDDWALFAALQEWHEAQARAAGRTPDAWYECWEDDLRRHRPEALARWQQEHAEAIAVHKAWQYFFFTQWRALRRYAQARGVRIIGDLPIFAARDSADVWAHRELFHVDEHGRPTVVAGVPPDYFSRTGQLWGNPLYDWKAMAAQGFAWWKARLRATLELAHLVRVDHFRGFEAYWEVPAGHRSALHGRWVKAPGAELFATLRQDLGALPLIAEDLGVITPEVEALRSSLGMPGMKVLQFAFELTDQGKPNAANPFLPHNYREDCAVYTGTHDNDTTAGWFYGLRAEQQELCERYLPWRELDIAWRFVRLALASVARLAVVPMQDVLSLGSEARMNTPGVALGNWRWRLGADALSAELAARLRALCELYGREPEPNSGTLGG
ncbi:MAG: 4-alpha-glucanotransferase [Deltaproteobacteria bacterium]|nr:4-alpha-glucanotransferase [Deltaproteobacteria bacterium]